MIKNRLLIQTAGISVIIFGGVFFIRYFKDGMLSVDQLIAASLGALIMIVSVIWRITHKNANH